MVRLLQADRSTHALNKSVFKDNVPIVASVIGTLN